MLLSWLPLPTDAPVVAPGPTNAPVVAPGPTNAPVVAPASTEAPVVAPVDDPSGEQPTMMGLADPNAVAIGDEVCFEGFIMDFFCIELGTLFDSGGAIVTLEQPEQHSVHCLIDVQRCRESPYEILSEPESDGQLYGRAFRVNDAGKAGLQALAAATGATNPENTPACTECTGEGTLARGFRAEVYGRVVALANGETPPVIEIVDAVASNGLQSVCSLEMFPEQNPDFLPVESEETSENETVERVVMAFALIAISGVGIVSVFGNQLFPASRSNDKTNE